MRFVFSRLFYALLAVGLVPISLSWNRPMLRWLAFTYDLVLITVAVFDAWNAKLPSRVAIARHFGSRFAVGAETEDSKARGIDGDRNDNSSPDSGAVYLY